MIKQFDFKPCLALLKSSDDLQKVGFDEVKKVAQHYCLHNISSIVNDGIEEVLYLLRKDPTSTKSTKSDSLHRCFYVHKKHKALNKRLSLSQMFLCAQKVQKA